MTQRESKAMRRNNSSGCFGELFSRIVTPLPALCLFAVMQMATDTYIGSLCIEREPLIVFFAVLFLSCSVTIDCSPIYVTIKCALIMELLITIILSQSRISIAAAALAAASIAAAMCASVLTRSSSRRRTRLNPRRCVVVVLFIVLLPSSIITLFTHDFNGPMKALKTRTGANAISEYDLKYWDKDLLKDVSIPDLRDWENLDELGRILTLQSVVDEETKRFKMPCLVVCSGEPDLGALGVYVYELNLIIIKRDYLNSASVETCLQTALHEFRHGYQHYIVDSLDRVGKIVPGHPMYYTALLWEQNIDDYHYGQDGYEKYFNQPMEIDSRSFAELETKLYLDRIN